jgi:hypothetical protein
VTELRTGRPGVRVPARTRDFSLLQRAQCPPPPTQHPTNENRESGRHMVLTPLTST